MCLAPLPVHWHSGYIVILLSYLITGSLEGLLKMSCTSRTCEMYDFSSVITLLIILCVKHHLTFLSSSSIQFLLDHIDKEFVVDIVITKMINFSIFSSLRLLDTKVVSLIRCIPTHRLLHLRTTLSFFRSTSNCRSYNETYNYFNTTYTT